jgi:phospholipid-transporting ATPase
LLNEDMSLIVCNEDNHWSTKEYLEKKLKDINEVMMKGEELEVKTYAHLITFIYFV